MTDRPSLTDELDVFLDELRREGFNIGAQEFIDVHDLLISLASRNRVPHDVQELGAFIGPLVCNTPQQQTDFEKRFEAWAARAAPIVQETLDVEAPRAPVVELEKELEQDSRWSRWVDRLARVVPLLVLGAAAVATIISELGERQQPPVAPVDTSAVQPPPAPDTTRVAVPTPVIPTPTTESLAERWGSLVERWGGRARAVIEHVQHVSGFFLAAVLVIVLVVMIRWVYGRWLARRFLSTRLVRDPHTTARLVTHGEELPPFERTLLFRAAQNFRVHRRIGARYLDAEGTVRRSVERGGWYSPIERHRLTVPEYLVLIDRLAERDHQARLYARLADWLVDQGVFVDRYSFDGDPRVCMPEGRRRLRDPGSLTLDELTVRYPHHRLIVVTEATTLFDPFSGEVASWADRFAAWPLRSILTPDPPEVWGRNEERLESEGWLVYPASEAGIHALVEHPDVLESWPQTRSGNGRGLPLPTLLEEEPERWLDRHEPDPEVVEELIRDLQVYLGDAGFRWLSACAVFPELHWHLTVALGRGLSDGGRPLLSEDRLAALSRLPWLRTGRMPLWLRDRLVRGLTAGDRARTETALHAVLERAVADPESDEALRVALRNPVPDLGRHVLRWLQRREPKDSPLREQLFAGFMGTRLSFRLPAVVRDLLRPVESGALSAGERRVRRTARICLPLAWLSVLAATMDVGGGDEGAWFFFTAMFSSPLLVLGWVGRNLWAFVLGIANLGVTTLVIGFMVYDVLSPWMSGVWLVVSTVAYLSAWVHWPAQPSAVVENRSIRAVRVCLAAMILALPVSLIGLYVALLDLDLATGWVLFMSLILLLLLPIVSTLGLSVRVLGSVAALPRAAAAGTVAFAGAFLSWVFGLVAVLVWAVATMGLAVRAHRRPAAPWQPIDEGLVPRGAIFLDVAYAVAAAVLVTLIDLWLIDLLPPVVLFGR